MISVPTFNSMVETLDIILFRFEDNLLLLLLGELDLVQKH